MITTGAYPWCPINSTLFACGPAALANAIPIVVGAQIGHKLRSDVGSRQGADTPSAFFKNEGAIGVQIG